MGQLRFARGQSAIRLLARVDIDDARSVTLNMILDTGAAYVALDRRKVAHLGIQPTGTAQVSSAHLRETVDRFEARRVGVLGEVANDVECIIMDLSADLKAEGLLGTRSCAISN